MGKNKTIDRALIMRAANRSARGARGLSYRAALGVVLPALTRVLARRYTIELRSVKDTKRAAPHVLATGAPWRMALIIARGAAGRAKKAGRIASALIYPDGMRAEPVAAFVHFKAAREIKFITYHGDYEVL